MSVSRAKGLICSSLIITFSFLSLNFSPVPYIFSILCISFTKISFFHSLAFIFSIYLLLFSLSSQLFLLQSFILVFSFIQLHASAPSSCHWSTCLKHHLTLYIYPTPTTCKSPCLCVMCPVHRFVLVFPYFLLPSGSSYEILLAALP